MKKKKVYNYYVDAYNGKSTNSGKSPSKAWDRIYFDRIKIERGDG